MLGLSAHVFQNSSKQFFFSITKLLSLSQIYVYVLENFDVEDLGSTCDLKSFSSVWWRNATREIHTK